MPATAGTRFPTTGADSVADDHMRVRTYSLSRLDSLQRSACRDSNLRALKNVAKNSCECSVLSLLKGSGCENQCHSSLSFGPATVSTASHVRAVVAHNHPLKGTLDAVYLNRTATIKSPPAQFSHLVQVLSWTYFHACRMVGCRLFRRLAGGTGHNPDSRAASMRSRPLPLRWHRNDPRFNCTIYS